MCSFGSQKLLILPFFTENRKIKVQINIKKFICTQNTERKKSRRYGWIVKILFFAPTLSKSLSMLFYRNCVCLDLVACKRQAEAVTAAVDGTLCDTILKITIVYLWKCNVSIFIRNSQYFDEVTLPTVENLKHILKGICPSDCVHKFHFSLFLI